MTVSEAVILCTERGLSRTPKTIRKWAARSYAFPESADILVRREDIENGFRWSIEATSLNRKIDEELEFERRKAQEPYGTGAHPAEPVTDGSGASPLIEQVKHPSKPVHTRDDPSADARIEAELRAQLKDTQDEVAFLREELRHRRKTDEALGSVIEAFRLNSESNQARMLDVQSGALRQRAEEKPRHDIVHSDDMGQAA
ncbi:MAG: hypothetical protein AAF689_05965 [Pseudomonadota bacterium]